MANLMHNIAALFLLTDPGISSTYTTAPVAEDKVKMAGMFDRYNRMLFAVYQKNLDINKSGVSKWQAGLGNKVDLANSFFTLGREEAVKALFALLIRSDGKVPSGLVNAYVEGGNEFRKHWSVGP